MAHLSRASDEEVARLINVANKTRSTLLKAGIPVILAGTDADAPGALIEVDEGADKAGGVFITWSLSPEFTAEVSSFLINGELTHPSIHESGKIKVVMIDAIIEILNAFGLTATLSEDDMRPLTAVVN